MDCSCPNPTSLTEIVAETCGVDLTQIQRIGFQRAGDSFDNDNATTPFDVLELSAWQAKMAANDDTKIVVTPLIGANPVITPGDAITTGGGDNSTLNGVEQVTGTNPSAFACEFKSLSAAVEKALKTIVCEKSLVVYLFLQGGKIAAVRVDATEVAGFPIQSPFVSDRGNEGFGTFDTVNMSFSLSAGWSSDLEIISPNFNPLTEL